MVHDLNVEEVERITKKMNHQKNESPIDARWVNRLTYIGNSWKLSPLVMPSRVDNWVAITFHLQVLDCIILNIFILDDMVTFLLEKYFVIPTSFLHLCFS